MLEMRSYWLGTSPGTLRVNLGLSLPLLKSGDLFVITTYRMLPNI